MLSDLKPTSWLMFWLHFISDKLFMRQSRKYFKRVAWIPSDHLHLQWKFKLWAGKFAWGIKAKHYWALSTNYCIQKVVANIQQCFAFPDLNLYFHWSWRWWDQIQAVFWNLFDFIKVICKKFILLVKFWNVVYVSISA